MASRTRRGALHVALLAGGSGTRFWPLSRAARPKQFLALTGGAPLLVETWRRVRRLAPADRIWVVAPQALASDVARLLPQLSRKNIVVEPSPRDTGPAVALACATIARRDPEALVGFFPTDHVVSDTQAFVASVRAATVAARDGKLVCLGVRPDRPATGFGYLLCSATPDARHAVAVKRFVEKPDLARAQRFVRSGRYVWNAGMFVWRVRRFLDEARRTEPAIVRAVERHLDGDPRAWTRATRLSVDFAVMERARDVSVVALDAGWDDVGSWDAAARLRGESGGEEAQVVRIDSAGSVVFGEGRVVALVDVPDVAVIDTPDALLVVSRRSSEKVRAVVDELRRRRRRELL